MELEWLKRVEREIPEGMSVQHEISWVSFMLMNTARPPREVSNVTPPRKHSLTGLLSIVTYPRRLSSQKLGLEEYQKTEYYILLI